MTLTRIPGGYRAYKSAVHEAYTRPMHNPCVRWSLARGFTAESELTSADDDQYTIGSANYSADTGNSWVPATHREYACVRVRLIAFQAAIERGEHRRDACEAARDAMWEFENE